MKIKGVTQQQIEAAAKALGLRWDNARDEGNYHLGVLRMATSIGRKGWKKAPPEALRFRKRGYSATYRGSDAFGGNGAVCFHGHWHFMSRIFDINPEAVIRTAKASYLGLMDFHDKASRVGEANVGSMMVPIRYSDACNCDSSEMDEVEAHRIQFGTLLPPQGGEPAKLINVRYLKQSDLRKCPFTILVPEHYRDDGTCKCNDPEHREYMKREWEYTDESFRKAGLIK